MMDFELKLSKPSLNYSLLEGLVMGASYFVGEHHFPVMVLRSAPDECVGGLLPMIPYFIFAHTLTALYVSIGISAVVLFLFGIVRARLIGASFKDQCMSAGMTMLLGGVAAGVSYGVVYGINQSHIM
jgi:hypothetical protein